MFPLELKLRGSKQFMVQNIFLYRTIEVTHPDYDTFKVNNLRLRLYFVGNTDNEREELRLQNQS
ncbi:hypothetical protein Goshw_017855 [Gossypium schwendimanii]|uniref:Uncharacterized protein n=1 Tax=Gossypium schwendimanii TaxID=34291 RepID=A0A7J9NEV1_GOSSC|nr:hypothetical protein [Gossypium schwendimanii]